MSADGISPAATAPTASHSGDSYLYAKIIAGFIMAIFFAVNLAWMFVVFSPMLSEMYLAIRRIATRLCTMLHHFYHTITSTTTTTSAVTSANGVSLTREAAAAAATSLPTFRYSAAGEDHPLDCPVCLTEFVDEESGKFLPGCLHRFHVECIEMWILSHSTCPLCRSIIGAEIPDPPV